MPLTGIGEVLRSARRSQGRSIGDAAADTRVRESFLAALEQEEFTALGGDVYAKGFLKSYARWLGLDPEPLLARYRAEFERPDDTAHARPPAGFSDPMLPLTDRSRPPRALLLGVVAVVLGLLLVGFLSQLGDDPGVAGDLAVGPEPVADASAEGLGLPSDPPATGPAAGPTGAASAPAADVLPSGATAAPRVVTVTVTGVMARVRVVEGSPPVDATLETGDSREITGARVTLQVDDAGAVEVTVDGQPLTGLGASGQAVEVTCEAGRVECAVRDA